LPFCCHDDGQVGVAGLDRGQPDLDHLLERLEGLSGASSVLRISAMFSIEYGRP
jgi:hypothetical protein